MIIDDKFIDDKFIDDKFIDDKSIYHLVMTNIANWKIHDKWRFRWLGKSSVGPCSSSLC